MSLLIILSTFLASSSVAAITFFVKWQKASLLFHAADEQVRITAINNTALQHEVKQYLAEKSEAIAEKNNALHNLEQAVSTRDTALVLAKKAETDKYQAQKEAELALAQARDIASRMEDWEKTKQESLKAAKEAMFETGGEVFRKEAEALNTKTMEGFQQLIASVTSLKDRVDLNDKTVNTVWRALSSPGGAGYISEIGLENSLKSFGLEAGRDFVMQYSVSGEETGKRLRPDAVIFLPGDTLLIVDSKASKFFLELAEMEGLEDESIAIERLKATMQEHLRSLASKGYKEAVRDYVKTTSHDIVIGHVMTVMFLHSENAIEKRTKYDSSFRDRAQDLGIILAGPTGLAGLLSLAKVEIARERQQKNHQQIINELSGLLGYVGTALDYAQKIGKGIESAARNYHDFTRSVNSRLLPKARKLQNMGVEVAKNKQLPVSMPDYHVVTDTTPVIEGEAEEVVPVAEEV